MQSAEARAHTAGDERHWKLLRALCEIYLDRQVLCFGLMKFSVSSEANIKAKNRGHIIMLPHSLGSRTHTHTHNRLLITVMGCRLRQSGRTERPLAVSTQSCSVLLVINRLYYETAEDDGSASTWLFLDISEEWFRLPCHDQCAFQVFCTVIFWKGFRLYVCIRRPSFRTCFRAWGKGIFCHYTFQ